MRSNGFYVDVASIMYNKEFMEIQEIKFNYIKTLPQEKLNDFKDTLVLEGRNYFDSNIKPYLISLNYDESAVNLEYLAFSEKYADFCMNRLKEGYWEREAEPWGPGKDAFFYKYNAFSFDLKRFDETERNVLFEKKRKELFKKIDDSVDAESKDNLKNTIKELQDYYGDAWVMLENNPQLMKELQGLLVMGLKNEAYKRAESDPNISADEKRHCMKMRRKYGTIRMDSEIAKDHISVAIELCHMNQEIKKVFDSDMEFFSGWDTSRQLNQISAIAVEINELKETQLELKNLKKEKTKGPNWERDIKLLKDRIENQKKYIQGKLVEAKKRKVESDYERTWGEYFEDVSGDAKIYLDYAYSWGEFLANAVPKATSFLNKMRIENPKIFNAILPRLTNIIAAGLSVSYRFSLLGYWFKNDPFKGFYERTVYSIENHERYQLSEKAKTFFDAEELKVISDYLKSEIATSQKKTKRHFR